MNARERMFHSIEFAVNDIARMQDIVIRLTRGLHEVHVAKEHEAKIASMKEDIQTLRTRMDAMQEFLYSCERPTQVTERRLSEIDVA